MTNTNTNKVQTVPAIVAALELAARQEAREVIAKAELKEELEMYLARR